MKCWNRLAVILRVAIILCAAEASAENRNPPADNDDSYKLPLFVPTVAQPSGGKVIFDDAASENDQIYSLPKRAAIKPSALSPAAGTGEAQKNYNKQYEEYQQQMKLYNEQMAEYKKQVAAQQAAQSQAPGDNDTSYVLPGQYSPTKKSIKPKPAVARPKAQPQVTQPVQQIAPQPVQVTQPVPVAQPVQRQQPQYTTPPATTNNSQYYQRYNYSDQSERAPASAPASTDLPNYYY